MYVKGDAREPDCIHSLPEQRQPASACRICKDGPDLAAWKDFWARNQDLIPKGFRAAQMDQADPLSADTP